MRTGERHFKRKVLLATGVMALNALFLTAPVGAGGMFAAALAGFAEEVTPGADIRHVVVYAEPGAFCAWPANNGVWIWEGREILVGFTRGSYAVTGGHNIAANGQTAWLARSLDEGETWMAGDPSGFVGDPDRPRPLEAPLDFAGPGFALRLVGTGYHTATDSHGQFFYTVDRGRHWHGPRQMTGLEKSEALKGLELTPRTDVLVQGEHRALAFLSARKAGTFGSDHTFVARTEDGGCTWAFLSWMVPPEDPHRAVMPQTVRTTSGRLVSAVRRRQMGTDTSWIDAYASEDGGRTWGPAVRVGETGKANGNPPALAALADGRLCCVYGNRTTRSIRARLSRDEGRTWEPERVLRDDYHSGHDDQDLGYPRLVQRADGKLVAIYYWASRAHPQQHIAASIWTP